MNDAKTLLFELLSVIPNGDKVAQFFAEDGVVELPFLHSLGMPTRHRGRAQMKAPYDQVGGTYTGFEFRPEDIKVLIDTPDQVLPSTSRTPRQQAQGE